MKTARETFNPASYALSHLKNNPFRSVTMVLILSVTIAFLLLVGSIYIGITMEVGGSKESNLWNAPGSIDMFEEFQIDEGLPEEVQNTMLNWLFFTSFLIMMVAIFIIYNTMAIAVEERKKEIGILRAVGFSSREVMRVFLIEGAFIGILSWIVALFFGTPLIVNLAAYLIKEGQKGLFFVQPRIPVELAIVSLLGSIALCTVSTYLACTGTVNKAAVDLLRVE